MRPTRRHCLKSLATGLAATPLAAQVSSKADASKLAMPGLYRGRVIAALPGSPRAVLLAVDRVLAPILSHAVALARGEKHGHG